MKALLAGSTGAIGSLLLDELNKDARFSNIIAITRRPSAIQAAKFHELRIASLTDLCNIKPAAQPKISANGDELHTNDLSVEAASLVAGTDVLFCCLGTTLKKAGSRENFKRVDLEGVKILADLAERMRIKHFILISAAGADKNSALFYNRVKGEAEEELLMRNIGSITIFRPGLLLIDRQEFRFGEALAIKIVRLLQKFMSNRFTASFATDAHALVHSMIAAAQSSVKGRHIVHAAQISPEV